MSNPITKELLEDRCKRLARATVNTVLRDHPNKENLKESLGEMFTELMTKWLIDDLQNESGV